MEFAFEPQIIFEDKHLLVVNKPCGIVSEDDEYLRYSLESLALDYLKRKEKYPQKCFIGVPHRLDRPVSGTIIFAKKRSTLKNLVEQFRARTTKKNYLAIAENKPLQDEALLIHWHRKNSETRKAELLSEEKEGTMRAQLKYKLLAQRKNFCLLEVELITGKYHQIRAQLAKINCPVVGDALYGSKIPYEENAIALHAFKIEINHPFTNERITFTAPLPQNEFWKKFSGV